MAGELERVDRAFAVGCWRVPDGAAADGLSGRELSSRAGGVCGVRAEPRADSVTRAQHEHVRQKHYLQRFERPTVDRVPVRSHGIGGGKPRFEAASTRSCSVPLLPLPPLASVATLTQHTQRKLLLLYLLQRRAESFLPLEARCGPQGRDHSQRAGVATEGISVSS